MKSAVDVKGALNRTSNGAVRLKGVYAGSMLNATSFETSGDWNSLLSVITASGGTHGFHR